MTERVFENNFDDLLNKTSNTISDTLGNVDVSNPFSDAVSPLQLQESEGEEEPQERNPVISRNPFEDEPSSVTLAVTDDHDDTDYKVDKGFEDIDVFGGEARATPTAYGARPDGPSDASFDGDMRSDYNDTDAADGPAEANQVIGRSKKG